MKMILFLTVTFAWSSLGVAQSITMEGLPKDQDKLTNQEGLRKFTRIPYYLYKSITRINKKSYQSYMNDFFSNPDLSIIDYTEREFEIFAYNKNFESKSDTFSFKDLLSGKTYEEQTCDEVCPSGLEILSVNREQLIPDATHFLSFRNKQEDFLDSIQLTTGYCWGHSTVMDDFHYLAFFDKENKTKQEIPTDARDQIAYQLSLIDAIVLDGKATIIPGFANLREFAEVPEHKEYLKVQVAKKWAKNAVKLRSLGNVTLDGKKMKIKRTKKLLNDVKERLLSNQTPRIIFAALGDSTYSHVLNVYGITQDSKGTSRLYVFETNFYPELVPFQAHWIEIDSEGNATYAPLTGSRIGHSKLGKIKFSFEEENATVDYVKGLEKFCRQITNCK